MDVNISEEIWKFFSQMSLDDTSTINETNQNPTTLIRRIDLLGRETTNKGVQLEIYDDGSVEKKYLIK